MKKSLVALFTLAALSIGAQSFAACCGNGCGCGCQMASPCCQPKFDLAAPCPCTTGSACPIVQPCCPAVKPCCPIVKPCCPAVPCCPAAPICPAPSCNDCCD